MVFGISMTTLSNFRNRLPQYGVKGRFERKNTTWKGSVSIVLYRINKLYIFFSPICFNCKYGLLFLNFKSRIAYDGWRHALHVNKNNWYQRLHCFSTFRCRIIVCFNVYYFWIFICKHIASPAQHIFVVFPSHTYLANNTNCEVFKPWFQFKIASHSLTALVLIRKHNFKHCARKSDFSVNIGLPLISVND